MGPNFWGLPSVGWQAISTIASVIAFVIAGGAAVAAWKQYRMNVQARRDQTRPYVTVDFEPSPFSLDAMDLVVHNCGSTAAYALSVRLDPEPVLNPGLLGIHHAAVALQGIQDDLHTSPLRLGPFPVVAESRVDYLDRIREEERPGAQPE